MRSIASELPIGFGRCSCTVGSAALDAILPLWVDSGTDALTLVEPGKRSGVKLVAGRSFSPHGGQRTMIRLPVWHDAARISEGLDRLR